MYQLASAFYQGDIIIVNNIIIIVVINISDIIIVATIGKISRIPLLWGHFIVL